MYKEVGGEVLTWDELSEVLLDVETQINRRPLIYVDDDVELPILTPSTFLFQRISDLLMSLNEHGFTTSKLSRKQCDFAVLTRNKSDPDNHHLRNSRVMSPGLLSCIPTHTYKRCVLVLLECCGLVENR